MWRHKASHVSKVEYEVSDYSRFATPMWVDAGSSFERFFLNYAKNYIVIHERRTSLQKELRKVTQRVNLLKK
jgi:vacuolar-type H+-ATPase subunit D/Vma8